MTPKMWIRICQLLNDLTSGIPGRLGPPLSPRSWTPARRCGKWEQMPGDALLPGDVISIGRPTSGELKAAETRAGRSPSVASRFSAILSACAAYLAIMDGWAVRETANQGPPG